MKYLCAALLTAAVCWSTLPMWTARFRDNDWTLTHLDELRTAVSVEHRIPLLRLNLPLFHGQDMHDALADPGAPLLSPWLFLTGMSVPTWIALTATAYALAGALSLYALCLHLGVAAPISMLAAAVFSLSSYVFAHLYAGHWCFVGVGLLPLIWLGLVSSRWQLGGAALAWLMLDGQLHVPVWAVLFGTVWVLCDPRQLLVWVQTLACAAVLSAVRWVPMLAAHGEYVARAGPPAPTLAVLAQALTAQGQSAELKLVQDWAFWEYSCYIGIAGCAVLVSGVWLAVLSPRRCMMPWLGMLLFSATAMLSKTVFTWLRQFPLWRTERCPSRYIIIALFAACVTAALGWQTVWTGQAWQVLLALLLMAWLTYDCSQQVLAWIPR